MNEGLQVLHMLATSPATAKFISTKLAVRFVSDTPPPALVDRMAKAFLTSDGDIKTVLRTMFDSPEFWSPEVYRAKVKTPLEFVVSAVRASDAEVTNAQPLVQSLEKLGMPLYGMQTPNGYSWMAEHVGEYGRSGEPDELCAGAERRSHSGSADGLDAVAGADRGGDGAGGVDVRMDRMTRRRRRKRSWRCCCWDSR